MSKSNEKKQIESETIPVLETKSNEQLLELYAIANRAKGAGFVTNNSTISMNLIEKEILKRMCDGYYEAD